MKVSEVVKNVEKRFGKEAIAGKKMDVEFVHSGSIALDLALGGGIPKGRIVEFMGWESSGKTTLALTLAAEMQKLGKKVAYIDSEQAMDLEYANSIGVDVDIEAEEPNFYLSQPDCGEDALEIAREFAKSEDIGLIVIDSVAALVPKSVIQGEAGDAKMAVTARMLSQIIPTLVAPARKTGCIILFISQYREKIGVMFGDPTTTMGGNALKFYASQRLDIARCGQEKDGDEVVANKTRVKVKKNKVAPPFKQAEFQIAFGVGIDRFGEIINMAVDYSIIQKSGSWYSYSGSKLGQGIDAVKTIMRDNPELFEEVREKLLKTIGI